MNQRVQTIGRGLGLTGLFLLLSGFGGCPSGGGGTPPPPPKDAVWCDIKAIPCGYFGADAVGNLVCLAPACADASCRVPASVPDTGDRTCFNHTATSPSDACAALCNPFSGHLADTYYPFSVRALCTSGINTNAAFHSGLNSQGYLPNGCMDPGPGGILQNVGTNQVALSGAGTATLDGGSAATVAIINGYFNMTAPKTTCASIDPTCPTQFNQAEVDFATFPFSGHTVDGLRIFLDENVVGASGTFVPSLNRFVFTVPQGVVFDARATVDGALTGLAVTSAQQVLGSLDLTTNELTVQFDVSGPFNGQTLEISGTATTANVMAIGPSVTLAPTLSVDATNGSCSADVTIAASASSPTGLPLTLYYSVDGQAAGTNPVVSLDVGTHSVSVLAIDSNGMQASAAQTVTVSDKSAPIITAPPDITISTCTNVNIGQATASDDCGGASPTVTNDAPTKFAPGVTVVTYTTTDSHGNVATAKQRVTTLLRNDASCCPAGTHVIIGTSNNDTLTGTSGSDCILGLGGQDRINGLGGNDYVSAGDGDDIVDGGDGNDVIFGGSGQDSLSGGNGNDTIFGDDGDDILNGGAGDDQLNGGQGQDTLNGQDGNDTLRGDDGFDTLNGGNNDDTLVGGAANDHCDGGSGTNTFASCEFGAPNSCTDGALDGSESAVDCGGGCPRCAVGSACTTTSDCQTGVCSSNVCGASTGGRLFTTLSFTTDWGGGYCAVLNVENPSDVNATSFTVQLNTNGSTIYTSWNGTFSGTSGNITAARTITVPAGATDSSVGFCANRNAPISGQLPLVGATTGTF